MCRFLVFVNVEGAGDSSIDEGGEALLVVVLIANICNTGLKALER